MSITNLKKRSLVVQHTRDFFINKGYLEVDTPLRSPAIIPEAHIDPMMSEGHYLQASPELYMKRLLSQGLDKVFQICKCFRKNERGSRHLPELTMLEWYGITHTYEDLMDQCEGLLAYIAGQLGKNGSLDYQGHTIDLQNGFHRLTIAQAFDQFGSMTADKAMESGQFDEIISFEIEPHLGINRPCFLYDYPAPLASLAKLHPDNQQVAQRFELYIAGIELANGFTELTDSKIQKQRFMEENRLRSTRGLSALPMPETFLSDLKTMPEAAGIALGMDRLAMLFCDAPCIDEVVAFTPESL